MPMIDSGFCSDCGASIHPNDRGAKLKHRKLCHVRSKKRRVEEGMGGLFK